MIFSRNGLLYTTRQGSRSGLVPPPRESIPIEPATITPSKQTDSPTPYNRSLRFGMLYNLPTNATCNSCGGK